MAELINKNDTLNNGRVKINTAIQNAEEAKNTADSANSKAEQSLQNSKSTQEQLDTIVIEGDSSIEAAQARVSADGTVTYTTLKERLDTEYTKLKNIEIGGRNLLRNTSKELTYVEASGWGDVYYPNDYINLLETGVLQKGETYTLRVYLETDNDFVRCVMRIPNNSNPYRDFSGNSVAANSKGYSTVTFTVPNDAINAKVIVVKFTQNGTPIQQVGYGEVKLEKGNKPTDWTPAPEDVQNKLDEYSINVKDYGAKGDGVTDDTQAIKKIIETLDLDKGTTIFFPEGKYLVGSEDLVINCNNVHFVGKGRNTVIKLIDNVDLANGGFYADAKEGITFKDLAFDGNQENQINAEVFIRLRNCNKPNFENVFFYNLHGTAIAISECKDIYINRMHVENVTGVTGRPGEGIYGADVHGGSIMNLTGFNLGDHLIYLTSTTGNYSENINFVNVKGERCGENGLTTGATFCLYNDCRNFSFVNCDSLNSRAGFTFIEGTNSEGVNSGVSPSGYMLVNCSAINSHFASGFLFFGPATNYQKANGKLINCKAIGNIGAGSASGFRLERLDNITLSDCFAEGNGYRGFEIASCKNVNINNPEVLNNGQLQNEYGIRVVGSSTLFSENIKINNATVHGENHVDGVGVVNDSCRNIFIEGGDFTGNQSEVYLPQGKGYYRPRENKIVIMIQANGSEGVLSILSGEHYIDSISSSEYGLNINYKNLPASVVPAVNYYNQSSDGFGGIGYIYTRSTSNIVSIIGLKVDLTSPHTPLNTIANGSIGFIINL